MTIIKHSGDISHFGQPVTVALEFTINGFLVAPDDGTVTYTLRGRSGTLAENVAVPAGDLDITIDGALNEQLASETTGVRSLTINFLDGGLKKSFTITYYLTAYLMTTVTCDSVRALLGVEPYELPDESITLMQTHNRLKKDLDLDPFDNEDLVIEANELLLHAEALKQARVLQLKVLQQSKVDDHLKTRATINFRSLLPQLEAGYLAAYRYFGTVPDVEHFEFVDTITDVITTE